MNKLVLFPEALPDSRFLVVLTNKKPARNELAKIRALADKKKVRVFVNGKQLICQKWAESILRDAPEGVSYLSPADQKLYYLCLATVFNRFYPFYQLKCGLGEAKNYSESCLYEMERLGFQIRLPHVGVFRYMSWHALKELRCRAALNASVLECAAVILLGIRKKVVSGVLHFFLKAQRGRSGKNMQRLLDDANTSGITKVTPMRFDESTTGAVIAAGFKKNERVFIKGYDALSSVENEIAISRRICAAGGCLELLLVDEMRSGKSCYSPFFGDCSLDTVLARRSLHDDEFSLLDLTCKRFLRFLANANLEHRDIRPENIRVRLENDRIVEAKLCDFGRCTANGRVFISHKKILNSLIDSLEWLGENERYAPNKTNDAASSWAFLNAIKPNGCFWDDSFYKSLIKRR